jgi:ABC-type bacteriocin/lantibiotic exporter with double-glycine peptidase domain
MPFDDQYIIGLIWQQRSQIFLATACLLFCTASNLAAPVLTGMLMDTLVKQKPVEDYIRLLAILMFGYIVEPCLTKVNGDVDGAVARDERQWSACLSLRFRPFQLKVYMENMIKAGERVLATLRLELFRVLLMQKIAYFDKHTANELTNLISVELDTIRSFIFKSVMH